MQTDTTRISSSLLCRSKVRAYLLDYAKKHRHHKFTRVSADTYDKLEGIMRQAIQRHVDSHPSSGSTL
jgi:hypothetical protein